ncbi:sugar phosphate isomerase/epimerase family protein [Catalinimonas niigatensis]|uniref:sugar phosphate isomerase/epimerase family protein n=1 Tax=Catalinimonas niigatensis TaxID=1397264 RepID=UPI002665512B|nr:sugar phosphate isomerase/epimerase family protein [Catalinimonas niigatensis]WPP48090.1 sugar phosphate isomerase/epimerase family protein [Catalinimonas niigatensis]
MQQLNRRSFLSASAKATAGLSMLPFLSKTSLWSENMFFNISLAQWSLNKSFRNGTLDPLDFAQIAKKEYGISAIEYVSQLFSDKADDAYIRELKKRADDHGVTSVLIMVDREGNLGTTDEKERAQAVENHHKWVEAAKELGCHSIRVNAAGQGTADEVKDAAIDGLGRLTEFADKHDINVIVENHGGYSSIGTWLVDVMEGVSHPRCGTLPDFGNFRVSQTETYDMYKGVEELMPYAKGVSAKSYNFDKKGNCKEVDFARMMQIVKDAGYTGYVGIEYEGNELGEKEGIIATKKLLEKVGSKMS